MHNVKSTQGIGTNQLCNVECKSGEKSPQFAWEHKELESRALENNHMFRFREHEKSFSNMDWPPQSQDLNPVENTWDVLEKTLRSDMTLPSSMQDLVILLM